MKPKLTLVIGNKAYSSWSFRPWILLKQAGIPFEEVRIAIRKADSAGKIEKFSKAGRVPVLADGNISVWESTAICEYLAEKFPKKNLWPKDTAARAIARSVSHEMHAGFAALRKAMPFNCRAFIPLAKLTPDVQADIDRVTEIWRECRAKYGKKSEFLFGDFTIADAMFAPVCLRFKTYGTGLDPVSRVYVETIASLPATREWIAAAKKETERIEESELQPATK